MQHELTDGNPANTYYLGMGIFLFIAEWISTIDKWHIPDFIMQVFQLMAWGAAIVAACVGTYLSYKKSKNNKYHD